MIVIKDARVVVEMMLKVGYERYIDIDTDEPDDQLDLLANYCFFFDEMREEIQEFFGISLDVVMYSWFYWCECFFAELGSKGRKDYGDGGLVDYLIEVPAYIEQSGLEYVDFELMETIYNEVNEMTNGGLDAFYDIGDN